MLKIIAVGACVLGSCGAPSHFDEPMGKPACLEAVVVIWNGAETSCDVSPPQRLDVLLPAEDVWGDGEAAAYCADMGADDTTWNEADNAFVCEGVDY